MQPLLFNSDRIPHRSRRLQVTVTTLKRFRTPAFRWTRTLLFLFMGLSGVIPSVHAVLLYGVCGSARARLIRDDRECSKGQKARFGVLSGLTACPRIL
ncbi:hypothetical protein BC936DRAFT_142839 [Jimgerdemannia flammicorona]|uniref:Transmembrane protein n=1 Tax=Jimgerdemannia flammicorona TaxID=994334 RepID=A0A432ZZY7_9FUNG|nr:hypothetical protein BC936DRAFT_142839 [Jimgerdemannia flammicorona]